jgi:hypothetical protein
VLGLPPMQIVLHGAVHLVVFGVLLFLAVVP